MVSDNLLPLLIGMGMVTYIPRVIPILFLANKKLPDWFINWLDLIPASILSALLLPDLITSGIPRELDLFQAKMVVAIPTLLFAVKTKSLGGTVIVGMALYWIATVWGI